MRPVPIVLGLSALLASAAPLLVRAQDFWTADTLRVKHVLSLDATPDGALYVSAAREGRGQILRSLDDGRSWQVLVDTLDLPVTRIVRDHAGRLFAGFGDTWRGDTGFVRRSTDDGASWQTVLVPVHSPTDWDSSLVGERVTDLIVTHTGVVVAATNSYTSSGGSIYASRDGGSAWEALDHNGQNSSLTESEPGALMTLDVAFSDAGPRTRSTVFRSTDLGRSWELTLEVTSMGWSGENADGLFADRDQVFAFGRNLVYRSDDDAVTWSRHPVGELRNVYMSTMTSLSDGTLYAGGLGLYRSTDRGQTWSSWERGLPERNIDRIVTSAGGTVYVATADSGLYHSPRVNQPTLPPPVQLSEPAISPNPCTYGALVSFTIGTEQNIEIDLVDLRGALVRRPYRFHRRGGTYGVHLDTRGLAAGTYFVRLRAGESVQVAEIAVVFGK